MIVPTITYVEFLFGSYIAVVGGMLAMACVLLERIWLRLKKCK